MNRALFIKNLKTTNLLLKSVNLLQACQVAYKNTYNMEVNYTNTNTQFNGI